MDLSRVAGVALAVGVLFGGAAEAAAVPMAGFNRSDGGTPLITYAQFHGGHGFHGGVRGFHRGGFGRGGFGHGGIGGFGHRGFGGYGHRGFRHYGYGHGGFYGRRFGFRHFGRPHFRYGYGYRRGYYGYGPGLGFGFATGALLGSALAAPAYGPTYRYGGSIVAYCSRKYHSFDPVSGTYLGYDGRRHACVYP